MAFATVMFPKIYNRISGDAPVGQETAVERVLELEQAEALADDWSK